MVVHLWTQCEDGRAAQLSLAAANLRCIVWDSRLRFQLRLCHSLYRCGVPTLCIYYTLPVFSLAPFLCPPCSCSPRPPKAVSIWSWGLPTAPEKVTPKGAAMETIGDSKLRCRASEVLARGPVSPGSSSTAQAVGT